MYYHQKLVTSIDIENELLASGSNDRKVKVWNMKNNPQLIEVSHLDWVLCVKGVVVEILDVVSGFNDHF